MKPLQGPSVQMKPTPEESVVTKPRSVVIAEVRRRLSPGIQPPPTTRRMSPEISLGQRRSRKGSPTGVLHRVVSLMRRR